MQNFKIISLLIGLFAQISTPRVIPTISGDLDYSEKWGYVNAHPGAFTFWWLFYANGQLDPNRPLVLWIQGGPGSSGCGYGNFQEIGPLDQYLQPRKTTWLQKADLLFIDNPVGTGFSYVTNNSALTTSVGEIAQDLLTFAEFWFATNVQYQNRPFYIFSESYGGKMSTAFVSAIQSGKVKCNFKGYAMGDSWISPIDYVTSWGNYLYHYSLLSWEDLQQYNQLGQQCLDFVNRGLWLNATACYEATDPLLDKLADSVSWYDVLKRRSTDPLSQIHPLTKKSKKSQTQRVGDQWDNVIDRLMNGAYRKKFNIIPDWWTFSDASDPVYEYQKLDFMKPVVEDVDKLLSANYPFKIVIYQGQLDLICCTVGTEKWMQKLKWKDLGDFWYQNRTAFHTGDSAHFFQTAGFVQQFKNFMFFWIMRAGHMVPGDAPYASLKMLDLVFL